MKENKRENFTPHLRSKRINKTLCLVALQHSLYPLALLLTFWRSSLAQRLVHKVSCLTKTPTHNYVRKSNAKILIQYSIEYGIESRIEVAEPNEHIHKIVRYTARIAQLGTHYVNNKKGQPTGHKYAHYDGQSFGDLGLGGMLMRVSNGTLSNELAAIALHVNHHRLVRFEHQLRLLSYFEKNTSVEGRLKQNTLVQVARVVDAFESGLVRIDCQRSKADCDRNEPRNGAIEQGHFEVVLVLAVADRVVGGHVPVQ
ncbi:hypothetical protein BpHYR1_046593 [Brachionus plicatilis]|uniref:Uncharacterized protein n=1 Tax=Brachionus plicatilis TaxID=10195 RepID=A0A3M7S3F1_BRAPC|nr:hypothetical protein BpHYR1_046593 [Brachionus plicatilis]